MIQSNNLNDFEQINDEIINNILSYSDPLNNIPTYHIPIKFIPSYYDPTNPTDPTNSNILGLDYLDHLVNSNGHYKTDCFITDDMILNNINIISAITNKPTYIYEKYKTNFNKTNYISFRLNQNMDTIKEMFLQIKLTKPLDDMNNQEMYNLLNTTVEFLECGYPIFSQSIIIFIFNSMIYKYDLQSRSNIIQILIYTNPYTQYGLLISNKNNSNLANMRDICIRSNNISNIVSDIELLVGGYILPNDIIKNMLNCINPTIQIIKTNISSVGSDNFLKMDHNKIKLAESRSEALYIYFDHDTHKHTHTSEIEYIEIEYIDNQTKNKINKIYYIDNLIIVEIFGSKLYILPLTYDFKNISTICDFYTDLNIRPNISTMCLDRIKFEPYSDSMIGKISIYKIRSNIMINHHGSNYYRYV